MALPNNNISPGSPPLLWSSMKDALDKINDNFIALDLATGGDAVDLSVLNTDVSPEYTAQYSLGTTTRRWKSIFTPAWASSPSEAYNGVWIGGAQIRGIPGETGDPNAVGNTIIDLPLNSTVNGDLIIDPSKTFFKEIEVDSDKRVVAADFGSLLSLTSGYGITLSVTSASDEITFDFDPHVDIIGNILAADETTVLVDSATGKLKADVGVTVDWNIDVDGNVWTFGTDGSLALPGTATIGNDILRSVNDLNLQSESSVKIQSATGGAGYIWNFSSAGTLISPGPVELDYLGSNTFSLVATGAGGRIAGESGKTFKVVLNNGVTQPEWTFGTDGGLTFPDGATITGGVFTGDVTGNVTGNVTGDVNGDLTGNVNGGDITADTFSVGTFDDSPTSNYFQVENTSANRVRTGGPGQQIFELRSYYSTSANGNEGTTVDWRQSTTGTTDHIMARLVSRVTDISNANESGELVVKVADSGTIVEVGKFDATGFVGNVVGDVTGNVSGNAGTVTDGVYTSGSYSDPSWLTISQSFVGLGDVENTALSTWTGSSNITTVGTLDSLSVTNDVGAGSLTGNIFTNLIDSSDSSDITVTPSVVFSANVRIENDLTLVGKVNGYTSTAELKAIVAASTTWGDFQAAIAAL